MGKRLNADPADPAGDWNVCLFENSTVGPSMDDPILGSNHQPFGLLPQSSFYGIQKCPIPPPGTACRRLHGYSFGHQDLHLSFLKESGKESGRNSIPTQSSGTLLTQQDFYLVILQDHFG